MPAQTWTSANQKVLLLSWVPGYHNARLTRTLHTSLPEQHKEWSRLFPEIFITGEAVRVEYLRQKKLRKKKKHGKNSMDTACDMTLACYRQRYPHWYSPRQKQFCPMMATFPLRKWMPICKHGPTKSARGYVSFVLHCEPTYLLTFSSKSNHGWTDMQSPPKVPSMS